MVLPIQHVCVLRTTFYVAHLRYRELKRTPALFGFYFAPRIEIGKSGDVIGIYGKERHDT